MKKDKNTHRSCVYELNYHLVFVTKYRKNCINNDILNDLNVIFKELLEKWDCELSEFNGEENHVHLLVKAHPNLNLSNLVNNLKTVSSRRVRKMYKEYLSKYYWKSYFWHRAYCIVSVGGASLEVIKKYIQDQKNPNGL